MHVGAAPTGLAGTTHWAVGEWSQRRELNYGGLTTTGTRGSGGNCEAERPPLAVPPGLCVQCLQHITPTTEERPVSLLTPTPVARQHFSFIEDMLVAEISDLGPAFRFGRVWNDSCDEGLTLVDANSGRRVVYAVDHVERYQGDLLYWDLIPASLALRSQPAIRLFND